MHRRTFTDPSQGMTLDYSPILLSGPKPTMLASSVQAVVACMQKVFTLVLFIKTVIRKD